MEVDLVVASKSHPIKLEVVFGIETISSATNISGRAKSPILVQAPNLQKLKRIMKA